MKPTAPAIPKFAFQMEQGDTLRHEVGSTALASRKIYIPHADGSRTAIILFSRVDSEKLTELRAQNKVDSAEKTAKALGKFLEARGGSKVQIYRLMNAVRKDALHDAKVAPMLRSIHEEYARMNPPSANASRARAASAPESSKKHSPTRKIKEIQQKYFDAPKQIAPSLFANSFEKSIKLGQTLRMTEETIKQLETPAQREEPRATALPKPTKPLPVPPQRPLKSGAGKPLPQIPGQSVPATPKSVAIDPNTSKKLDPAG